MRSFVRGQHKPEASAARRISTEDDSEGRCMGPTPACEGLTGEPLEGLLHMWGLCSALPVSSDAPSATAQILFVMDVGNDIPTACPEEVAGKPMHAEPAVLTGMGIGSWLTLFICTLRMPALGCTLLPGCPLLLPCAACGDAATWKPEVLPLLAVPLALLKLFALLFTCSLLGEAAGGPCNHGTV